MPTNAPTLTDAQCRALAIAEAERWQIWYEAATGDRVRLRHGRPDRLLLLTLTPDNDPPPAPARRRAA